MWLADVVVTHLGVGWPGQVTTDHQSATTTALIRANSQQNAHFQGADKGHVPTLGSFAL